VNRFDEDPAGVFIKAVQESLFEAVSVLQLDFTVAVKLPCVGGDPLAFEKTYVVLTCLVVFAYAAALLVLPRIGVCQRMLLSDEKAKDRSKGSMLYGQFTYRVGIWLVLTHAVSCRIALSNMQCLDFRPDAGNGGGGTLTPDDEDNNCQNPAWWILLLVHGIGFPLMLLIGAALVRRQRLGGTCCKDKKATTERQLADTRSQGELGLWRYYLGKSLACMHVSLELTDTPP
jgi:hypothetical protein